MLAMSGMAAADVEEGWPMDKPNTYDRPHVMIDFEEGTNETCMAIITSQTSHVVFENDGMYPWVYGCKGCGLTIYPNGGYIVNGNCCAWCNIPGNYGDITFPNGTGHVSFLASTWSGLYIDAYNESGVLITSSGYAPRNWNTTNFTRLSVDRPQCDIYSVNIHDSGNFWVIDDLIVGIGHGQSAWAHCQKFIHSEGQDHWNENAYTNKTNPCEYPEYTE